MKINRRISFPRHSDYAKYKPLLREDFRHCCAYCGAHERIFGALRNMTIDHFRPKANFPNLLSEYANLYYCCGECNTYKGDRWPSDMELADGFRFIDVCAEDSFDHLAFDDAAFVPLTNPGRFTVISLRLDRAELTRRHREIATRFARICSELSRIDDLRRKLDTAGDPALKGQLDELHSELIEDLREIIFPTPLVA